MTSPLTLYTCSHPHDGNVDNTTHINRCNPTQLVVCNSKLAPTVLMARLALHLRSAIVAPSGDIVEGQMHIAERDVS